MRLVEAARSLGGGGGISKISTSSAYDRPGPFALVLGTKHLGHKTFGVQTFGMKDFPCHENPGRH
jgi:hypothetical protein